MALAKVSCLLFLALIVRTQCKSVEEISSSVRDCKNDYSTSCFKLDIANFVERFAKVNDVKLLKGISLVKDEDSNDTSTADIVAGSNV